MKSIKSIYKIGTGPSSSHTMGPERACKYMIETYGENTKFDVILYGSLALTGKGHLTDYIIEKTLGDQLNEFKIDIRKKILPHENTLDFIDIDTGETTTILSIGGGEIKIYGQEENLNNKENIYPHSTLKEINKYLETENINYLEYIQKFDNKVFGHLEEVWKVMKKAVEEGLLQTEILPGKLKTKRRAKNLASSQDPEIRVMSYAYAVSEQNASGNIIVTAPTCGACGVLPAVLYDMYKNYGYSEKVIVDALAIAGLFGQIVVENATISGAEAGCQAEVGTATAMAAAAIMFLKGGKTLEIESAAEIGLEHQLGLTCDPVYGYVQVPCIQRNAVGSQKAIMASKLAGIISKDEKVSFDVVVKVMFETGKEMSENLRETSKGGLAIYLKQALEENQN